MARSDYDPSIYFVGIVGYFYEEVLILKVYGSYKVVKKIGIYKKDEILGLTIHFMIGDKYMGCSTFSSPPATIDHVGIQYLRDRGFNIKSEFQKKYFCKKYEQIAKEYRTIKQNA